MWACSLETQNDFVHNFQTSVSTPFMSSPFSLFSGGIPAPIFQTPASLKAVQTTYNAPQTSNPLDFGWNPFQSSPTTSQPAAGGNPTFSFGNQGTGPSTSQTPYYQTLVRPNLPVITL